MVDERKADDITVFILREPKPKKLSQSFMEHGFAVSNPFDGIYYIDGKVLFPTQIVVARELKRETHAWIRALSKELIGDGKMYEALMELMEPQLSLRDQAKMEEANGYF